MLKRILGSPLFASLQHRYDRWVNKRLTRMGKKIILNSRSVYILPTRFGLILGGILFILLLNAMNYENSMVFMLTFLLAGIVLLAMYHTFGNISGLTLSSGKTEGIYAGERATVIIYATNIDRRLRYALFLGNFREGQPANSVEDHNGALRYLTPSMPRGVHRIDRLKIWTVFPFGLFCAWSWFRPGTDVIVYPQPKSLIHSSTDSGVHPGVMDSNHQGDDDFVGMRRYQDTDSPNRIAWKAMAHSQTLLSKEFCTAVDTELWLNFDNLENLGLEDRLSQLCYWILECEKNKQHYGLILPGKRLDIGSGEQHKRHCLEALAFFNRHVNIHPNALS